MEELFVGPCHYCLSYWTQDPDNVMCFMLQDEYMECVSVLRRLLAKKLQAGVQQMHATVSGLTADITKAKSSIDVFQQAASLASSEDGRASMTRECTAIANQLALLTADEHNLKVKIEQSIEKHQDCFCQQLWVDVCNAS